VTLTQNNQSQQNSISILFWLPPCTMHALYNTCHPQQCSSKIVSPEFTCLLTPRESWIRFN